MTETIVGIDLGTTNSEVAIYRDGRSEILADETGERIIPSVVGLSVDGALLVGTPARNQARLFPDRTIRSIKRVMGSDRAVTLGEQVYQPPEISAMILRRLKAIAEARLGAPISKAVITVPAYFSDVQREATRQAGEIAGLDVVRMINEPTAAALVYEAGQNEGKSILVYDLGGGTFDVSVVRIADGVVEVIASHGNNHLGGDDFDAKIIEHIVAHGRERFGIDLSDNLQAMARLGRAAEDAKKHLSDHPFALIEEEHLIGSDGAPFNLSLELARDDYETMIAPFVEETLESIHTALKSANLTVAHIEEVVLVGGTTKTPMIRRRLTEIFGRAPRGEVDPDLCVALGASLQAAAIGGENVSAVLVDITPYTFGTSVLGELDGALYPYRYAPVIAKNTPIPVRRSEVFYTTHANQSAVDVRVFQGEHDDALQNIQIGEFVIDGLSEAPAGNPVLFEMALDRDGILHVSAQEKVSGLKRSVTITQALPRYDAEQLTAAKARVDSLFGTGDPEAPTAEGSTAVAALLDKARARLDTVETEDRDELIDLIEEVEDARRQDDTGALDSACQRLTDLLYFLES